ncbi:MAG TPA: histidine kinase [Pyrinomonadaceae bacterium]|jgi:sensor histidine kinase YesM
MDSLGKQSIKYQLEETPKSRWMWRLIGFLAWTFIGLSFASRTYVAYYLDGLNPSWKEIYSSNLTDYYLWGLASIFIFYLCRRYPVEREKLFARLGFYFIVGVFLTFLVLALSVVVYWNIGFVNKERSPTVWVMFSNMMTNLYYIHQFTLIYWVTVVVGQAFEYYRQLRVGKLRAAQLAEQLAQAQLAALKMQVHPHFLFNTLNSIAALMHRDIEAADRMIARLSDFLRMTLRSSNEPIITLAQELEFLKTYLEIEKVRFQERLAVEIEVEPQVLDAQVPNLILQPLVENAIRHGLARQTAVGSLRVSARRVPDKSSGNRSERVKIQIKDNGRGIQPKRDNRRNGGEQNGLGLANTRARLAQVYDEDFRFEIVGNAGESGTTVTLDVPYFA